MQSLIMFQLALDCSIFCENKNVGFSTIGTQSMMNILTEIEDQVFYEFSG